jgi:PhoH-like ATPase
MGFKNYKVELDVLASAGEDGLKKLAADENNVYIDFLELEEVAGDRKHPLCYEIGSFLEFTNKIIGKSGIAQLHSYGRISGESPPEDSIYITRSPSKTSKLKREGKSVDFPDFLRYSTEFLKSGLLEGEYNNLKDINLEKLMDVNGWNEEDIFNNQYVCVNNQLVYLIRQNLKPNKEHTRYFGFGEFELFPIDRNLENVKSKLNGFKPKNLEQLLAFNMAKRSDIEVSFITGGSGSGKSIIAYAASLEMILGNEKQKRRRGDLKERIIFFKPNNLLGGKNRDIGFLPGTAFEKIYPIMRSFEDSHDLCGINQQKMPFKQMLYHPQRILDSGFEIRRNHKIGLYFLPERSNAIEIEHLQFGRGRTFVNKVIFIDEAQNYTPYEMKQLVERVGIGSKLLIVGDPEQVDGSQNDLSPEFNGLLWAAKAFRNSSHPRISFMHLDQNFRSQAAEVIRRVNAPKIY